MEAGFLPGVDGLFALVGRMRMKAKVAAGCPDALLPPLGGAASGSAEVAACLNLVLHELWPRVRRHAENMLRTHAQPALDRAPVPGVGALALCEELSLGDTPPSVVGAKLTALPEGGVRIDSQVEWKGDVELHAQAGMASAGVSSVSLEGELCVLLRPALPQPPFFGAAEIFFANPPTLSLGYAGLAQVAHLPGLSDIVSSAVESALAAHLVLPQRAVIPLVRDAGAERGLPTRNPPPSGVLRLRPMALHGSQGSSLRVRIGGAVGGQQWDTALLPRAPSNLTDAPTEAPLQTPVSFSHEADRDFPGSDDAEEEEEDSEGLDTDAAVGACCGIGSSSGLAESEGSEGGLSHDFTIADPLQRVVLEVREAPWLPGIGWSRADAVLTGAASVSCQELGELAAAAGPGGLVKLPIRPAGTLTVAVQWLAPRPQRPPAAPEASSLLVSIEAATVEGLPQDFVPPLTLHVSCAGAEASAGGGRPPDQLGETVLRCALALRQAGVDAAQAAKALGVDPAAMGAAFAAADSVAAGGKQQLASCVFDGAAHLIVPHAAGDAEHSDFVVVPPCVAVKVVDKGGRVLASGCVPLDAPPLTLNGPFPLAPGDDGDKWPDPGESSRTALRARVSVQGLY
eukprot:TRINITY_DN55085_c0_g1_i1.p1 TRINITY_DN55085_c0_g1~~TRINITY_DN55085_c0_g1_i1.p1  ORF type:complete len:627 (+),score=189.27 TRINITY_DN55085_c0_g1_i1:104-1984(+)